MRYEGKIGLQMKAVVMAAALLLFGLGCRHQPVRQPLPVSHTPVELESAPEPESPPMLESPEEPQEEVPTAAAAAVPKRERRRSAKPANGTGSAGAAAPTPGESPESGAETGGDDSMIGDLTAGGESNSQNTQEAEALLTDNDRRLKGLPESVQRSQRAQLNKVKNFDRQAHKALGSGDAEGAKTLATKAKLLLDDLAM